MKNSTIKHSFYLQLQEDINRIGPKTTMKLALLSVCCGLMLMSTAWATTDGTYVLDGGSYSINVTFGAGTLTVTEPNKTSVYRQRGASNEYLFTNPNNGVTYGLRVVDNQTLEAFKPVPGNVPSTLKLRGSAPAAAIPDSTLANAEAVAEKYYELSESDPANAQTWTHCAAAALSRSMLTSSEAEQNAEQNAMLLKFMGASSSNSPCPDAISNHIWRRAAAP